MSITQIRSEAFDRSVGPLMHLFSEEQIRKIAGMEPDDSLDERLEYLAGRSNEGALTAEERTEQTAPQYRGHEHPGGERQVRREGPSHRLRSPFRHGRVSHVILHHGHPGQHFFRSGRYRALSMLDPCRDSRSAVGEREAKGHRSFDR